MKQILAHALLISRLIHVGGASFDITTTLQGNRYTPEGNVIVGQSPARQIAVVGGLTLVVDQLTSRLAKDHPKTAVGMNTAAGLGHWAAGAWNIHVMNGPGLSNLRQYPR